MGFDDLIVVGHWFLLVAGIAGFIIGFLLLFAKGVVEKLSKLANKALPFDRIAKFFDSVPASLDSWIMINTKAAGIIFIILSIILILNGLPAVR